VRERGYRCVIVVLGGLGQLRSTGWWDVAQPVDVGAVIG
jgi:hypothetical protein